MLIWRDRAVRSLAKSGAKGVWFPTQFSAWIPALPSLLTVHDMAAYLAWNSFGAVAKAYMPTTLLTSCIHAKDILVVSESSANDLHRLFPWTKSRTTVALHGLPTDVRKKSEEIGCTLHRTEGPTSLLFLDGANPRKRLDLCLQAIEILGWSDMELTITGNPEAVTKRVLSVLGRVPENVSAVGRLDRPDLLDTFAKTDVLVYPSDFEGFGFPLIEAMAFGTSAVSFPGNAEKEVGKEFAVYADKPDVETLLKSLRTALERCRDAAWQDTLKRHALSFTWDDSVSIHRQAFEDLASG